MAPTFSRLNQLGTEPMGEDELIESNRIEPLVDRVKRAAEKIRQEWANEQMAMGANSEYEHTTQSAESSTGEAQSPSQ